MSVETSLLISFAVGLSSSAIVLKILVDKGEVNSSHGTLTTGILLFQDICVVLMVMVITGMGDEGKLSPLLMIKEIAISIVAVFGIVVAVNYLEKFGKFTQTPGDKVYIPYEASATLGSLGSIKEIFTAKG